MPRPASAGVPVKSPAAVRAGGKPADSCDGGRLPEPLFAPAAMTTATPTAIATVMGMKRPVIRLRDRIVRNTSRTRDARCGAGAEAGAAGRRRLASSPTGRSSVRLGAAHSERNSCGGGIGTCGPLEMVGVYRRFSGVETLVGCDTAPGRGIGSHGAVLHSPVSRCSPVSRLSRIALSRIALSRAAVRGGRPGLPRSVELKPGGPHRGGAWGDGAFWGSAFGDTGRPVSAPL